MGISTDLIYDVKRKLLAKYPRFSSEIAVSNIEFKENLKYHTVATDGKNVYVDPNYFESLSENERIFTIAHEIMHIKFMHMFRLKDKDGKKRDPDLWNIATDAIINANLERDGFTIKEGYVNMPEALNYSAEELYQKLLEEKEKKQKEQQNEQKQEQEDEKSSNKGKSDKDENQNSNEEKLQGDDHSLWEDAFKQQNSKEKEQKDKQSQKQEENDEQQIDMNFDERGEFEDNRKEKREKFKSRREKTQKDLRNVKEEMTKSGNIGESKEAIDWKVLLRREVEKTETIWSQRRSIAENNFAYRLEENDLEDEAETEVMIDVSGSVDENMVKGFLRQLKPLLKESKLQVGCFDTKFYGFKNIQTLKDINNFSIPGGGGTDLDLPVRSFSKKREINKIIFTDGYGYMPKEDLKKENVIWLVYGKKNFQPCCGKVINITEKQLEQLRQIDKSSSIDGLSR